MKIDCTTALTNHGKQFSHLEIDRLYGTLMKYVCKKPGAAMMGISFWDQIANDMNSGRKRLSLDQNH